MQETPCPLCGGQSAALCLPHSERSVVSDGRVLPHALRKLSCLDCGAASHVCEISERDLRTIYTDYKLAGAAPKSDAARARVYAQWIQGEAVAPRSILEIGCGSGALLQELSTFWPDVRCFGVDPALPGADRSNSKIRLERGFVEDIPNDLQDFDLIVAVNVIEHLPSPRRFLASLRSRLAPKGQIIIVCPAVDPPNVELVFYDHLYSFTVDALNSAARTTSLVTREGAPPPSAIGDFHMMAFEATDEPSMPMRRQNSFRDLCSKRQTYLRNWSNLDLTLLKRSRNVSRLVAFGGGQTAAVLRAYAPRTWERIELIVLDDTNEAWDLGTPVSGYEKAARNLDTAGILICTAPRAQKHLAERLRGDGLYPITWDDLIAN